MAADPFNLERFVEAQRDYYDTALAELTRGQKLSHWMWFIFPQLQGLGSSEMSRYYAIRSLAEAEAYMRHPLLGPRLLSCTRAVLGVADRTALQIVGATDVLKLRSCATLFAQVSPAGSVFHQVLEKYFNREPDLATIERAERAIFDR